MSKFKKLQNLVEKLGYRIKHIRIDENGWISIDLRDRGGEETVVIEPDDPNYEEIFSYMMSQIKRT